jgi:predicted RNase H-like HicB family nuclease
MKKTPLPVKTPGRQFTAVIQRDGTWFTAFCPEVPGANGQGRTRSACLKNLVKALELMLKIQEEELADLCRNGAEQVRVEAA